MRWSALATIPDTLDDDAPRGVALRPAELPDETLVYTLASRFCESDRLSNEAWRLFGATPGGYDRVRAIMDFVNSHLTYTSGSSGPSTSALDVLTSGKGVCRDYAHLMVALRRAMNLPARYAFGYFPDIDWTPDNTPMDFHACRCGSATAGTTSTRVTTSSARERSSSASDAMQQTPRW